MIQLIINELINLSKEFPFVEWGILISKSQEGSYRFPSRDWIDQFVAQTSGKHMNICTHICGRWVKDLFKGELNWEELPSVLKVSQRVQINTHADYHIHSQGIEANFNKAPKNINNFIFQWDNVNNDTTYFLKEKGIKVQALFDTSGGAGILPDSWPEAPDDILVGFAGGLGPHNVLTELPKITAQAKDYYWVDMERQVRSEDDSILDLAKVRKVLELMAPFV